MTPGKFIRFSVTDTGHGIEKHLLNRIFEPYFTTKNKEKGTGLGLSVVHGIVKSYNGDIRVYSTPGKDTVFNIYLPVIDLKQEEAGPIMDHLSVQGGDEHILLVDDEEPILKMEKQMLERLGYRVTSRTSSLEALEAFRLSSDKFDLTITDMTMPNMTGEKLTFELKQIRKEIPVILCTGFSEKISKEKAEALGIDGFLMKPIMKSELSKTIRTVLDSKKGG
ncbi:MAG: response regulator [bacterium]|nr:response regulator [bacterium]